MSGTCISLSGSTQCPAFNASSISTNSNLYTDFPFLRNVTNLTEFDNALNSYVLGSYIQSKYSVFLGCQGDLSNTSDYYARYTTSAICSGLVQSSESDCDLSAEQSRPLCAEDCALMASSEEEIAVNDELCPDRRSDYLNQIRSDFTVCTGPDGSLTGSCISAADNEPNECGFRSNLIGLCGFCASSTVNSTDSCCMNANASSRCEGVDLPTPTTSFIPIYTSGMGSGNDTDNGLSGGQIAGIVIGSVAGFAILAVLLAFGLIYYCRRKREAADDNSLNKPNPQRKGSLMQQTGSQAFGVAPGRVARMSALREAPSSSPGHSRSSGAFLGGSAKYSDSSDSEGFASPGAMNKKIPPTTGKRQGSLSSNSALAGVGSDTSPRSGTIGQFSSPEGLTSGQSEQLSSFQDYYSRDDIHPGDKVAVLWAYQPRAGDEFGLERGEMIKVIGIWDDGWATGVRIPESAEEYDARHREQRDSGVSGRSQRTSPAPSGEIKAFPLVCVCLPQHWRKIIDGAQGDDEAAERYGSMS
ncbi:hypothetical protein BDW71DRAFT_97563 [Aspergillus fruticulosus]